MEKEQNDEIKKLKFDNLISIIVIVLSLLNIYGDILEQEYVKTHHAEDEKKAKFIYIFVLSMTILIYGTFVDANYKNLENTKNGHEKINLLRIRFIGSTLLLIGASFLLFYQIHQAIVKGPTAT